MFNGFILGKFSRGSHSCLGFLSAIGYPVRRHGFAPASLAAFSCSRSHIHLRNNDPWNLEGGWCDIRYHLWLRTPQTLILWWPLLFQEFLWHPWPTAQEEVSNTSTEELFLATHDFLGEGYYSLCRLTTTELFYLSVYVHIQCMQAQVCVCARVCVYKGYKIVCFHMDFSNIHSLSKSLTLSSFVPSHPLCFSHSIVWAWRI